MQYMNHPSASKVERLAEEAGVDTVKDRFRLRNIIFKFGKEKVTKELKAIVKNGFVLDPFKELTEQLYKQPLKPAKKQIKKHKRMTACDKQRRQKKK